MASDTDLWMSVNKAAQEKYQSSLDAKGSLISESFPLWLQSPRKGAKLLLRAFSLLKVKRPFEIKLPLPKKDSPVISGSFFSKSEELTHQMPVVNFVEMPSLPENSSEKSSSQKKTPTPGHKRVLSQEEFDR